MPSWPEEFLVARVDISFVMSSWFTRLNENVVRVRFFRYTSKFFLVLMLTFSANSGPIFEKKLLNLSHMSRLFEITLESTIIFSNSFLLLLDLHIIWEIVFHVIFMSFFDWWNRLPEYFIFASRIVGFRMELKTERLFFRAKCWLEFGGHPLNCTYILSLNLMDRSIPDVIHLFFLWRCLWNLTYFTGKYIALAAFICSWPLVTCLSDTFLSWLASCHDQEYVYCLIQNI